LMRRFGESIQDPFALSVFTHEMADEVDGVCLCGEP